MKLERLQFGFSDVIPANVQNIPPLFLLHIFADLMEKEPFTQFYDCFFLKISYEFIKSRIFE